MGKITTVGIDLAKNVFQIHGVDDQGKAICRKKLNRSKVLEFWHGSKSGHFCEQ